MGNYKLRISSMIPNSWFYKYKKDTGTSNKIRNKMTKTQPITISSSSSSPQRHVNTPYDDKQQLVDERKSYYFTRDITPPNPTISVQDSPPSKTSSPDLPRRSSKKKRPSIHKKQVHTKLVSEEPNFSCSTHECATCSCQMSSSYDELYGTVDLPPIITKSTKQKEVTSRISTRNTYNPVRKAKGNCYSPRLGNRVKVQGINSGRRSNGSRRSLAESMAVIKTSMDPWRDFKESMVEMILENNIKTSKDLEDLLACYLSLNSDEYHELIINVFKQIWFESTHIRL